MRGPTIGVLAVLVIMTAGCGQIPSGAPAPGASPTPTTRPTAVRPTPTRDLAHCEPDHCDRPTTSSPRPPPSSTATPSCPAAVPDRLSLSGVQGRSFAFAPLDDPDDVTVEGRVSGSQAWSTSKVLVAAAFLDTTADGDPDAVSAANRRLIAAALQSLRRRRRTVPASADPGPPGAGHDRGAALDRG